MSSSDVAPFVHPLLLSRIVCGLGAMPGLDGKFAVFGSVALMHCIAVMMGPALADSLPPPADVDIVCAMQDFDAVAAAALDLVKLAIRALNIQFTATSFVRDIAVHPTRKGECKSDPTAPFVACEVRKHCRIVLQHGYTAGECLIDVVGVNTDVSRHVVPTITEVRFRGGVVAPVRVSLPLLSREQLTWFLVNSICNERMPTEKRARAVTIANALKRDYELNNLFDAVIPAEIKGLDAALLAASMGDPAPVVPCACHVYGQIQAAAARRTAKRAATAVEQARLTVSPTATVSVVKSFDGSTGTPGGEPTRGPGVADVGVQCDLEPAISKCDGHHEHDELVRLRERHRLLQIDADFLRDDNGAYSDSLRALRCKIKAANDRADDAAAAYDAQQLQIRSLRQRIKSAHRKHTDSKRNMEEQAAELRKDAANAWAMFRALESEQIARDARKNDQIESITIAYADAMRGLFQMKSGVYGPCIAVESVEELYRLMKQRSPFHASSPVFQRIEASLDLEMSIKRDLESETLSQLQAMILQQSKPPSKSARRRQRVRAARRGGKKSAPAAHAPSESKPPTDTMSYDAAPDQTPTAIDCLIKTQELCKMSPSLCAARAHVLKRQTAEFIGMPEFMSFAEDGAEAPDGDALGKVPTGSLTFFIRAVTCIVAETIGPARMHAEASDARTATSDTTVARIETAAKQLNARPLPRNADAQCVFARRIQERYIGIAHKIAKAKESQQRLSGISVDTSKLLRKYAVDQADNVPEMTVLSVGVPMDITVPPVVQCVMKLAQLFRGLFAAERVFHNRANEVIRSALCISLETIAGRKSAPLSRSMKAFMRSDCGALGLFPEFQDDAFSIFGREVPVPTPAVAHEHEPSTPSVCKHDGACAEDCRAGGGDGDGDGEADHDGGGGDDDGGDDGGGGAGGGGGGGRQSGSTFQW